MTPRLNTRGYFRRQFLRQLRELAAGALLVNNLPATPKAKLGQPVGAPDLRATARVLGVGYSEAESERLLDGVLATRQTLEELREIVIGHEIAPAFRFDPVPEGTVLETQFQPSRWSPVEVPDRPDDLEQVAFWPVTKLAKLVESRRVSSEDLTRMYIKRLRHFDPILRCVVTLLEESGLGQAKKADSELAAGRYRGLLHGIPWGVKDLFATRDSPTTWGTSTHQDRVLGFDSTIVARLEAAGAVLVAKLSLGPLARGDEWYKGQTKNPWNTEQGSGGSSAGSAAAVAAGLVGFSVGSSTLDSIIGPSARCGVTGLRPTYGRVSRYGAMTLSWTLDKVGPICRSVEDCAAVLTALIGPDGKDRTVAHVPFNWDASLDVRQLRVGYIRTSFAGGHGNASRLSADEETLKVLRSLTANIVELELPELPAAALLVMHAEAAAAFDSVVRSHSDEELVELIGDAWPGPLRQSLLIPAVDYIRANRIRTMLMQQMAGVMASVDAYVLPTAGSHNSFLTNLTGHPCVTVPNGFVTELPTGVSFVGRLFGEETILALARAYQEATSFHRVHPPGFRS